MAVPPSGNHEEFLEVKRLEARRQWREYYYRNRHRVNSKWRNGGKIDRSMPFTPRRPGPTPIYTKEERTLRRKKQRQAYYARNRDIILAKQSVRDAARKIRNVPQISSIVRNFRNSPHKLVNTFRLCADCTNNVKRKPT